MWWARMRAFPSSRRAAAFPTLPHDPRGRAHMWRPTSPSRASPSRLPLPTTPTVLHPQPHARTCARVRTHTHNTHNTQHTTHTAHSCTDVCVVAQEGVIRMSACWVTTTESPTPARLEPTHPTYGRTVLLILFSEPNHNNFTRAQWVAMDGTSASAPAFAGMITLINQMRKSAYVHNKRHTRHTPHTPHTTHATHTHTHNTHTHTTHTHTTRWLI
jgi:hypothetical protein